MMKELKSFYNEHEDKQVLAYYKMKNDFKVYYDFQEIGAFCPLYGLSEILEVEELLYYIKEQEETI